MHFRAALVAVWGIFKPGVPASLMWCPHVVRVLPAGTQPVVGFVGVQQATKLRKSAVEHQLLADKATDWVHLLNTRDLTAAFEAVAEDATFHVRCS